MDSPVTKLFSSSSSFSSTTQLVLVSFAAAIALHYLIVYRKLGSVPGPLLAKISDIPRLYWVWTKKPFEHHIRLHQKYGKLVRLGPNMVSVSDPKEIQNIYGFNYSFNKSDFYSVMLPYINGKAPPGTIALQDSELHRKIKKPVVGIFSVSNLVAYEPFIDSTMKLFISRLKESYTEGKVCDFGAWLEMFVFDALGELTFSKKYGFLEKGKDIDNIIHDLEEHFEYVSLIGQMPWIDTHLQIGPLISKLLKQPNSPITDFQFARMGERQALMQNEKSDELPESYKKDLLSKFMAAQASDASLPPWAIITWIATNIGAGSDTTAIILRAIFYNLLKHPETLCKLYEELDNAAQTGKLADLVTWKESQQLPYLEACIKEAERIHPAVGLPLERVVPPEGAKICGQFFEGGTVVGINAWVVHQDEIFGQEPEKWRPERWLCAKEQRTKMEAALFTFGAGSRVCYGKPFSHLIIYKLVPTLLRAFNFKLAIPTGNWKSQGRWFVVQKDFLVKLENKN